MALPVGPSGNCGAGDDPSDGPWSPYPPKILAPWLTRLLESSGR